MLCQRIGQLGDGRWWHAGQEQSVWCGVCIASPTTFALLSWTVIQMSSRRVVAPVATNRAATMAITLALNGSRSKNGLAATRNLAAS